MTEEEELHFSPQYLLLNQFLYHRVKCRKVKNFFGKATPCSQNPQQTFTENLPQKHAMSKAENFSLWPPTCVLFPLGSPPHTCQALELALPHLAFFFQDATLLQFLLTRMLITTSLPADTLFFSQSIITVTKAKSIYKVLNMYCTRQCSKHYMYVCL